jgi:hypothetical protein
MQWDCERSAKRARRPERVETFNGLARYWKRLAAAFMSANCRVRSNEYGAIYYGELAKGESLERAGREAERARGPQRDPVSSQGWKETQGEADQGEPVANDNGQWVRYGKGEILIDQRADQGTADQGEDIARLWALESKGWALVTRIDGPPQWVRGALPFDLANNGFVYAESMDEAESVDRGLEERKATHRAAIRAGFAYHRKLGKTASKAKFDALTDRVLKRSRPELKSGAYNPPCEVGGSKLARWIEAPPKAGLRFVGYADQLARSISHEGWHTDEDGANGAYLRGAVYQLPARKGRPVFVAGYGDPHNGEAHKGGPALLDFESVYMGDDSKGEEAQRDAARAADQFAQSAAESEREYNEAWQAGSRWADIGEEIRAAHAEARQLVRELKSARRLLKGATSFDGICRTIRDKIERARESITELRAERDSLFDSIRERTLEAFNQGAGIA